MALDILLGLQWGDEGKGKVVDVIGNQYHAIARFQGGANAGHTLFVDGKKYVLHQVPSGAFRSDTQCIIGNGMVIDPAALQAEVEMITNAGYELKSRLWLSNRAHFILPSHKLVDEYQESLKGPAKIGSTLRGISPAYQDKAARQGIRLGDVLNPDFEDKLVQLLRVHHLLLAGSLQSFDLNEIMDKCMAMASYLRTLNIIDTELYINDMLHKGHHILAEGAQGSLLDQDFGAYPFVTSNNTIAAGACVGLGVSPRQVRDIYGVFKAYCTRVGSGPFPTELDNEMGEMIRQKGGEFGATTGRPRRTGWLDLPALRYAVTINGVNKLIITKADVLGDIEKIDVCNEYVSDGKASRYPTLSSKNNPSYISLPGWPAFEDGKPLPATFEQYLQYIENEVGVPIQYISTGPAREQMIVK